MKSLLAACALVTILILAGSACDDRQARTEQVDLGPLRSQDPPCFCVHPQFNPGDVDSVISEPTALTVGGVWSGWWDAEVAQMNSNGVMYPIEMRWNIPDSTPVATVSWLVGGRSGGFYREAEQLCHDLQDTLATKYNIRSVDIIYHDQMGSQKYPANGFTNISVALAAAVYWGYAEGFVTTPYIAYGNSGGANLVTGFLLFHGGDGLMTGAITGGGPWWMDLTTLCDTTYLDSTITEWTFADTTGLPCSQQGTCVQDCFSTLGQGSQAQTYLPNTDVVVLIGDSDPRQTFNDDEADAYLAGIEAHAERHLNPAAPHQIFATQAGAAAVMNQILTILAISSS